MISKEEVKNIARLARIELTEKEVERFQEELSSILDYFELLKKVNTKKIEPTFHPTENYFKENATREDSVRSDNIADELIKLSPAQKERRIRTRSIL